MLLLTGANDLLRVITSAAVATDVHASYVTTDGSTTTPGRTNTPISTATTTTVVGSPGSATHTTVKTLCVRNRHASTAQDVTIVHTDGTNAMELVKATLAAGDALHYDEHNGFTVRDNYGRVKTKSEFGAVSAAVGALNTVVLAADVTNNNGSANTIADVTGLSFAVVSGETYWFEFVIAYTAAATTTGSRWAINGPTTTLLNYRSEYTLTATSTTVNSATAYDIPAAASASSLTAGNVATIWGIIKPSADGTVIARFASEISASAIVAKAGSTLRWIRTL
jgi:hypothetical protein